MFTRSFSKSILRLLLTISIMTLSELIAFQFWIWYFILPALPVAHVPLWRASLGRFEVFWIFAVFVRVFTKTSVLIFTIVFSVAIVRVFFWVLMQNRVYWWKLSNPFLCIISKKKLWICMNIFAIGFRSVVTFILSIAFKIESFIYWEVLPNKASGSIISFKTSL